MRQNRPFGAIGGFGVKLGHAVGAHVIACRDPFSARQIEVGARAVKCAKREIDTKGEGDRHRQHSHTRATAQGQRPAAHFLARRLIRDQQTARDFGAGAIGLVLVQDTAGKVALDFA